MSPCGRGTLEDHTIYHLPYPEGDSINDLIPKDPYALQYIRVDNAIHILKSLGLSLFMAKTDLKSAFSLIPVQSVDRQPLGNNRNVKLHLPFGLRSARFLFNRLCLGMVLKAQLWATACSPYPG